MDTEMPGKITKAEKELDYSKNELVQALKQQLSVPAQNIPMMPNLSLSSDFFMDPLPNTNSSTLPDTFQHLPPSTSDNHDLPEASVVVPAYSDISSADNSPNCNTNNLTLYHPGLCMYADKSGILNVKPDNLIPGRLYKCNDNFELVDQKEDKEHAETQTLPPNPASFNISITSANPGQNFQEANCAIM